MTWQRYLLFNFLVDIDGRSNYLFLMSLTITMTPTTGEGPSQIDTSRWWGSISNWHQPMVRVHLKLTPTTGEGPSQIDTSRWWGAISNWHQPMVRGHLKFELSIASCPCWISEYYIGVLGGGNILQGGRGPLGACGGLYIFHLFQPNFSNCYAKKMFILNSSCVILTFLLNDRENFFKYTVMRRISMDCFDCFLSILNLCNKTLTQFGRNAPLKVLCALHYLQMLTST